MKNRLSAVLNTLTNRLSQLGRTLFSLTLWLAGLLFLFAGFAALMHQGLNDWNSFPHFFIATALLIWATKRYAKNWTGPNKKWFFVSMGGLALVVILAMLATITYQRQDSIDSGGEFSDIVGDYAFGTTKWTVRANIEDFADFMTWWSNPEKMTQEDERKLVLDFFNLSETEHALTRKNDKSGLTPSEQTELYSAKESRREIQRSVEIILSRDVSVLFKELELNAPWHQEIFYVTQQTSFRFMPRINRLVVAKRDRLERYAYATLDPELTLKERDTIEEAVELRGYSSLVLGVGGIGTSPSIVLPQGLQQTLKTIAHERIHVLFYSTPLGKGNTPESRILAETTASILGDAIGEIAYCRYYNASACEKTSEKNAESKIASDPDKFDARAVLRETYLTADAMLEEGRIDEAEAYMDAQRDYLEENGLFTRKLNQAFFAFYGAYADTPEFEDTNGGIGLKLQELWSLCQTPSEFFNTVKGISSLNELERVLLGEIKNACTK